MAFFTLSLNPDGPEKTTLLLNSAGGRYRPCRRVFLYHISFTVAYLVCGGEDKKTPVLSFPVMSSWVHTICT
eukprot:CAMPEP_0204376402 /NCGR_PEP_ID=MMETSP0469-20131031/50051_1 /ASSEMBLY_ACC=CAM_ASM_000384 /TAXON_ID=2969 /ORGANISM="Oxyrrhis marina" /LENGTH=71 /DNA_ID=CAMNT_0051367265 /DNA_START=81 /DNA_END=293 /DNA_ORIENTATION=-